MDVPFYFLFLSISHPAAVLYFTCFQPAFLGSYAFSRLQRWLPFDCSLALCVIQHSILGLTIAGLASSVTAAYCMTVMLYQWTMAGFLPVSGIASLTLVDLLHLEVLEMATGACICISNPFLARPYTRCIILDLGND